MLLDRFREAKAEEIHLHMYITYRQQLLRPCKGRRPDLMKASEGASADQPVAVIAEFQ